MSDEPCHYPPYGDSNCERDSLRAQLAEVTAKLTNRIDVCAEFERAWNHQRQRAERAEAALCEARHQIAEGNACLCPIGGHRHECPIGIIDAASDATGTKGDGK